MCIGVHTGQLHNDSEIEACLNVTANTMPIEQISVETDADKLCCFPAETNIKELSSSTTTALLQQPELLEQKFEAMQMDSNLNNQDCRLVYTTAVALFDLIPRVCFHRAAVSTAGLVARRSTRETRG